MMAPTFESVRSEYARLWNGMVIKPERDGLVNSISRRLVAAKARYKAVEAKTGVPWFVIAVIHEREASQNWHTQLGQGDPLNQVSRHVPRGMGPYLGPDAWERAAIDALHIDGLDKIRDWSLERICYMLEKYNGFGYRSHGIHSPYLWSFSNQYKVGKFVEDRKWSDTTADQQCGCLPMLHGMMLLDPSIRFGTSPPPPDIEPTPPAEKPKPKKPIPTAYPASIGAIGATILASLTENPVQYVLPLIMLVAVGLFIWKVVLPKVMASKAPPAPVVPPAPPAESKPVADEGPK